MGFEVFEFRGLGFRVLGLGLGFGVFEFREDMPTCALIEGLGFKVWGLGLGFCSRGGP